MGDELMALMRILSSRPYPILRGIGVSTGTTHRQATYRIGRVNDLLRQHHAPIITIEIAKEIRLDSKARQKPEEPLQEMNQSS